MPTAATLDVKINSTLDDSGFDQAEQRAKGLGGTMKTALGTAGGFLLAQGIQTATSQLGGLISVGMDYEAQMANVNSILQLGEAELAAYSAQVLGLTNNPGITQGPADLAAGLYNVTSSGFTGADALMILESSAIAATAGLTDTDVAAAAATSVLNAYGMAATDVGHVNDVMFQTVNDGVITYEQLASNLGNVLPIASATGVSFEEVGAAYAQMTLQGVGASQAETQLAAVMRSALNPTDALTAAVQEQGYQSATAALETEGLAGFFGILQEASGGSEEELFNMLGTTEAVNAALALGSEENLPEYIAEVERMNNASEEGGATQKALAKQMQSSSFQIAKMKQQLQVLAVLGFGAISPAIQFMASGLTRLISGGVIPFIDVLGKAFSGGFEFRELVEQFPEPLQRAVGAFGSIAEAVGDVARAFGEGGLAGAFQTLTSGGELEQIGTALSALADEAWNALVAAFNAVPWGTLWDIAVAGIQGVAAAGIDLGSFLVSAAIDLGGDLLDAAGDLWGWVKGKLGYGNSGTTDAQGNKNVSSLGGGVDFGTVLVEGVLALGGGLLEAAGDLWGWVESQLGLGGGAPIGPGSGNRNGTGSFNTRQGSAPLSLGDVLVDGALALGGALKEIAGDVPGWLQKELTAAGAVLVDLGTWYLTVYAPTLVGWIAEGGANLWDWLKGKMGLGSGDPNSGSPGQVAAGGNITVSDWVLNVGVPNLQGWAADQLGDLWGWLEEELGPIVGDIATWTLTVGAPTLAGWLYDNKGDIWTAFRTLAGIPGQIQGAVTDWVLTVAAPSLGGWAAEIGGDFWGWLQGQLFGGGGSGDPNSGSPGQVLNSGVDLGIASAISDAVTAEIGELTGMVGGWKDDILAAIADIVPDSIPTLTIPTPDFDTSGILGAVDSVIVFIENQITRLQEALADLKFWESQAGGGGPNTYQMAQNQGLVFGAGVAPDPYDQGRPDVAPSGRQVGRSVQPPPPMVIPAPDTSAFDMAMGGLKAKLDTFAAQKPIARLGLNISEVIAESAAAMAIGRMWAASYHQGTFGLDISQVFSESSAAMSIGAMWNASYFQATFGLDVSQVFSEGGAAMQIGNAWGGSVFTASFSVDTSGITGAVAIARQAAADIAAVMPHSPAKEGPLKEPIKFDHIADAMASAMNRTRSLAAWGMAGVAGSLSGEYAPSVAAASAGRRGGGVGNTVVVITPDSENFSEIARKARRGGDFAELLPQLLRQGSY